MNIGGRSWRSYISARKGDGRRFSRLAVLRVSACGLDRAGYTVGAGLIISLEIVARTAVISESHMLREEQVFR